MLSRAPRALAPTFAILAVASNVVAALVASSGSAGVATAGCAAVDQFCTLAELVAGGRMDVNAQRFESFEVERLSSPVDLGAIRVEGIDGHPGEAGVRLAGASAWRVASDDFLGFQLGFRVRSVASGIATTGSSLALVTPEAGGGGFLRVDQTAYDAARREIGSAEGEFDSSFEAMLLADSLEWSERVEILAETSLFLQAGPGAGEASLDGIEIRYTLPEPALGHALAAALLLASIGTRSRRIEPFGVLQSRNDADQITASWPR